MFDAPYGLALAAGMLAAVNPCGFALLPAYLSFLIIGERGEPEPRRPAAVTRALGLTAAMALGFVAVFGVFGVLSAPIADAVAGRLPWASVLFGLALVGLGGWLLAGRQLPTFGLKAGMGPQVTRGFAPMVLFGVAYAVASLGCTVGPFLAVVVAGFRAGSVGAGVGLFLAYAAGMALVVGMVALAVAVARMSLVRGMRRAAPAVGRASGVLLVVAGAYVAWYGWYELRVFRGAAASDPIIDTAARIQSAVSGWLGSIGPTTLAVVFAALLAATLGAAVLLRRR